MNHFTLLLLVDAFLCRTTRCKRFPDALEWVINYAASKVHYFGINTPVDSCGKCGFLGETVASEDGFSAYLW